MRGLGNKLEKRRIDFELLYRCEGLRLAGGVGDGCTRGVMGMRRGVMGAGV